MSVSVTFVNMSNEQFATVVFTIKPNLDSTLPALTKTPLSASQSCPLSVLPGYLPDTQPMVEKARTTTSNTRTTVDSSFVPVGLPEAGRGRWFAEPRHAAVSQLALRQTDLPAHISLTYGAGTAAVPRLTDH